MMFNIKKHTTPLICIMIVFYKTMTMAMTVTMKYVYMDTNKYNTTNTIIIVMCSITNAMK